MAAAPRTHRRTEIRRHIWIYGALTPYVIIAIFPIYWMALTAFKQDPDLYLVDDLQRFFQRFRHVVVPMIAPILLIGFLFDTVFTLSDLGVVYLLTQGGPANATKILPVLAYQVGIQAGALGRGAAIALFLFPLLLPLMILLLRNLKRREY